MSVNWERLEIINYNQAITLKNSMIHKNSNEGPPVDIECVNTDTAVIDKPAGGAESAKPAEPARAYATALNVSIGRKIHTLAYVSVRERSDRVEPSNKKMMFL
jgi:hypothetical protein